MIKKTENVDSPEASLALHDFNEKIEDRDLIELFPFGVSIGTEIGRPVLILKDAEQKEILPVPLSPLEAGVTLSQATRVASPHSPHRVTEILMGSLGVKIKRCVFTEIKGHHQYVMLEVLGNPHLSEIRCRADEAMSLCLFLGTPLFSTKMYMQQSRILNVELGQLELHLKQSPQTLKRSHAYMM